MKSCLNGALWGDICGSVYEFAPERNPAAVRLGCPGCRFTDDTVLTLAVAKAILEHRPYAETIAELARAWPDAGWGGMFLRNWVLGGSREPYGSYGNGSAMRVSPVGWAFNTAADVLREAEASAACTHSHPDAVAAAQATALAVFLARKGQDRDEIREALEERFGYDLGRPLEAVRAEAHEAGFDVTWRSVPQALTVFFATDSFDACLVQCIALGADADTQAAVACAVAEAYYGADERLTARVAAFLPPPLRRIQAAFAAKYGV